MRASNAADAAAEEGEPAVAPAPRPAAAGRGYREGSQEATWLLDLMAGCVAVLLTVHNVRPGPVPLHPAHGTPKIMAFDGVHTCPCAELCFT